MFFRDINVITESTASKEYDERKLDQKNPKSERLNFHFVLLQLIVAESERGKRIFGGNHDAMICKTAQSFCFIESVNYYLRVSNGGRANFLICKQTCRL